MQVTVPVCDCSHYPNYGPNAVPCNCGESCAIQRVVVSGTDRAEQ